MRDVMTGLSVVAMSAVLGGCGSDPTSSATTASASSVTSARSIATAAPRSPMPGADEWRSAEVADVGDGPAMGCNGRRVREWIRVACAGRSDSGGRPTTVQTRSGEGAVALAAEGNTSVVLPVVEGVRAEIDFAWTDGTRTLLVSWPRGDARPAVVARFVGTAPRLDATTGVGEHRACACYRDITGAPTCDGMTVVNPSLDECAATYQDCLEVLECAAGKSAKWPKCPMGKGNLPPFGTCAAQCGDGKPACASGTSCNRALSLCQ